MLQTIKELFLQILPNIPQQRIQQPSLQDAFPSQQQLPTISFNTQNALQTQPQPAQYHNMYNAPYPPQTTLLLPQKRVSPTNTLLPSPQSFILPQSFISPQSIPPNQLPIPNEKPPTKPCDSQSSFDKTLNVIESDL